jgi:hypothetical protein
MDVERNCHDQLYMSLDAEIGGIWQSIWRESNDVQICEGDDGVIHYKGQEDYHYNTASRRLAADASDLASPSGMVKCSEIENEFIYINKTSSFTKLEISLTQEDFSTRV